MDELMVDHEVRHIFTEAELLEMHSKISRQIGELIRLEEQRKAFSAEIAAKITVVKEDLNNFATKCNNGYEYRKQPCKVVFRWQDSMKDIIHPETGEIIASLSLTPEDRQQMLVE